jgi:hypothetical protein
VVVEPDGTELDEAEVLLPAAGELVAAEEEVEEVPPQPATAAAAATAARRGVRRRKGQPCSRGIGARE